MIVAPSTTCLHTPTVLRSRDQIPFSDDNTDCPVCWDAYFSLRPDGSKVRPVLLSCNHALCDSCFDSHRENTLTCYNPWCHPGEHAPLNEGCKKCIEWSNKFHQMGPTKVVVMVEPKPMLEFLKDYFNDLVSEHRSCKLSQKMRQTLFDHFEKVLLQTEGSVFGTEGLAKILDPLLAVEDREAWLKTPFGRKMSVPASAILVDKNLPANTQNRDLWPSEKESWISTVLRSWAKVQIDVEGQTVDVDFEGYSTRRHEREGITEYEWLIKRILDHRISADGEVKYPVQWVGYTMPKYDSWISRASMSGPGTHRAYDRQHGL